MHSLLKGPYLADELGYLLRREASSLQDCRAQGILLLIKPVCTRLNHEAMWERAVCGTNVVWRVSGGLWLLLGSCLGGSCLALVTMFVGFG